MCQCFFFYYTFTGGDSGTHLCVEDVLPCVALRVSVKAHRYISPHLSCTLRNAFVDVKACAAGKPPVSALTFLETRSVNTNQYRAELLRPALLLKHKATFNAVYKVRLDIRCSPVEARLVTCQAVLPMSDGRLNCRHFYHSHLFSAELQTDACRFSLIPNCFFYFVLLCDNESRKTLWVSYNAHRPFV